MSYAIHFVDLPAEPAAFEATLRKMLAHNHEARRAAEQDSVRKIRLLNKGGRGDAPPGLWEEYELSLKSAQLAGDVYRKKRAKANAMEAMVEKAAEGLKASYVKEHAKAEADRAEAESACKLHEDATAHAFEAVKSCVTDEDVAHVPALYDTQIECAVKALIALLPGVGARCKTVRIQIGGHVEEDPKADGLVSVHIWPMG